MNWGILTSVFFLATFKFMFAGIPGAKVDIPFWQTLLATFAGGLISSAFFYYSAEGFMMLNRKRRLKKLQEALEKGIPLKQKKNFTRMNKFIVLIKRKIGIYGISFWAPLFLSVPIGSIVTAKFYGNKRITYPLIILGLLMNSSMLTGLYYLIF